MATPRQSNRCCRAIAAAAFVSLLAASHTARAEEPASGRVRRVRSENPTIAALIDRTAERSATFRRELAAIEATNGLVYIEQGRCGHSVKACLVMTVTVVGPYRLLRVKVDIGRDASAVSASLGHELQHVIEVLSDPTITDNNRIFSFFQRVGPTESAVTFETAAAVKAGLTVLAEIKRQ